MKSIASHNGLESTRRAFELMQSGNSMFDALVAGIQLVEDDPAEDTVGYGGLPNEDGVVELDAAIMHGPTHRGAGVAALRGIRHPTAVARCLLEQTNRVLLVGEGALRFATANGFQEENLLTESSRLKWMHWKRTRSTIDDWLPPGEHESLPSYADKGGLRKDAHATRLAGNDFERPTGTVHVSVLDSFGQMSCATSTSGHAFKLAGRVGDSPILGAGLYVERAVGSCGSIGWGEANMQHLSSFAVVEAMRDGKSPHEAGLFVLKRIIESIPQSMQDAEGHPTFNLRLFAMNAKGEHGGVCLYGPEQIAVTDEQGSRLEDCVPLYE